MNQKKLTDLNPKFILEEGMKFDCPACESPHGIRVYWAGTHDVLWEMRGQNFDDVSITPSIDGTPTCKFHGYVTNGMVSWP